MRLTEHDEPISPINRRLLGGKTGLLARIDVTPPERGEPQAYTAQATMPDFGQVFEAFDELSIEAGGKGESERALFMSLLGELVERYAVSLPDRERVRTDSYAALDEAERVPAFDDMTFYAQDRADNTAPPRVERVSETTPVAWCDATNLVTGDRWYVPANFVWLRTISDDTGSIRFSLTSNGAAAHGTTEAALLAGLYECIERDAFVRTWYARESPPRVDLTAVPALDRLVTERFPATHLRCDLLQLTSPTGVPVYAATLTNERDEYPKFLIGAEANVDPRAAMRGAVLEALQGWPYLAYLKNKPPENDADLSLDTEIRNLEDNVKLYGDPAQFDGVAFLLEGDHTVPDTRAPSYDSEFEAVLDRLEAAGHTPLGVDVTTPDVADAGFRVVRAYVPELVPLTSPAFPPAGHPALQDLNPSPTPAHPFP